MLPNRQLQRTRASGLRPPARAAELRRWASKVQAPLYFRCVYFLARGST